MGRWFMNLNLLTIQGEASLGWLSSFEFDCVTDCYKSLSGLQLLYLALKCGVMDVDFLKSGFRDLVELGRHQVFIEGGDLVLVWLVKMVTDINVIFINLAEVSCA